MLVAGQGMADQDGVGPVAVERAIGLVGDLQMVETMPGIEQERLVRAELRHRARRMIGLVQRMVRRPRGGSFDRGRIA